MKDNKVSILALSALALSGCAAQTEQRPNLLVIHTDEHNFRTLSCYQDRLPEAEGFVWGKGCNVQTPNIDRIADEGAICMSYYCASPVSTPSRASMITGNYPRETNCYTNGEAINRQMPTFGSILRDNGYLTSYVGKWHLHGFGMGQYIFGLDYDGGFTDNRYMMDRGHSPYFELDKDGKVLNGISQSQAIKVVAEGRDTIHMTDYFTNKAIEIMERDMKSGKPFCMMVSIPDPHTPDYARPPYHEMYDHLEPQIPISMQEENASKRPAWAVSDKNEATEFEAWRLQQYFGMVKHIDDSVGRMLETLEKGGQLDNTIVVFTSDHGDMFYEHKRMNKGNPYEASARIPFVIRYPKSIKAGTKLEKAYVNTSFTPTILSLLDVDTDVVFSGEDDAADFTSGVAKDEDRISFYCATTSSWVAAVTGQYKLVISSSWEPWLVDLDADPMELNNLYGKAEYQATAKTMADAIRKELKEHNILAKGAADKYQYGTL